MSAFTTVGQVLSLIGMSPVQHAGSVVIEKKRAAKSLFPRADISSLLSQISQGNISSILKNPVGALTGQLSSAMTTVLSSVPTQISQLVNNVSTLATNPQFTAVSGLSAAVTSITQASNALSGLTAPAAGQFGLLDVLGHASVGNLLGGLPSQFSMASAIAPLTATQQLTSALSFIAPGGAPANGNTLSPSMIASQASTLNGLVATSNQALSGMQDLILLMSNVAAIAGTLGDANASADALSFLSMVVHDGAIPPEPATPQVS